MASGFYELDRRKIVQLCSSIFAADSESHVHMSAPAVHVLMTEDFDGIKRQQVVEMVDSKFKDETAELDVAFIKGTQFSALSPEEDCVESGNLPASIGDVDDAKNDSITISIFSGDCNTTAKIYAQLDQITGMPFQLRAIFLDDKTKIESYI